MFVRKFIFFFSDIQHCEEETCDVEGDATHCHNSVCEGEEGNGDVCGLFFFVGAFPIFSPNADEVDDEGKDVDDEKCFHCVAVFDLFRPTIMAVGWFVRKKLK